MFNQQDAPLRILSNAALGDPLFALAEPIEGTATVPPLPPGTATVFYTDPRIHDLARTLADVQARVLVLESRTVAARWARFLAWLRTLWP